MDSRKTLAVLFIISTILLVVASCKGWGQSTAYPTRASVALPATFTPLPTQTLLVSDSYGLPPESATDTPSLQAMASESGIVPAESLSPTVIVTLDAPIVATPSPAKLVAPEVIDPDGNSLVYLSDYGNGTMELRLIDQDGGQPYTLANISRDTRLLDVTPDGRFAVFSNDYAGTFLIDLANGSQQIPLATTQAVAAHFSPTGDKLIYIEKFERALVDSTDIANSPTEQEYKQISGKMFLVDIASGQQKEVEIKFSNQGTLQFNRVEGASWSPDGNWFIFQVKGFDVDGRLIEGLFRYSLATSEVDLLYLDQTSVKRIFYPEANKFPILSPNGSMILTNVGGEYGLYTLPVDGGEPRLIFNSVIPLMESPQWSPDGKQIAILYNRDIFLINSNGSEFYNLTQTPYYIERHLSWSPDGQQLLYSAETRWGGLDIWRYDLVSQESYKVTRDDPAYTPTDNSYPFWVTAFTNLPMVASHVPVVEPDPIFKLITSPPIPPPENISLGLPQLTMNPPWWGERYLYRRKIIIDTNEPIEISTIGAERPVLAQVSFASNLILDQLRYGTDGHDIQLAWWGGENLGWVSLPCSVEGLDDAVTVITFPLQESIENSTDRYYLYYGSLANILRWESYLDLDRYSLNRYGIVDSVLESIHWREVQTLLPGNVNNEQEISFDWQNYRGRPVLELKQEQSVEVPSIFYLGEGTIALSINPEDLSRPGSILSYSFWGLPEENMEMEGADSIETHLPILFSDGAHFHFLINDQDIPFIIQEDGNQWHHLTATWRAGDFIRVYVDGEMVVDLPYEPSSLTHIDSDPSTILLTWLGYVVIGRSPENIGFSGQYMNLVAMDLALTEAEVRGLSQAARTIDISISGQPEMPVVVAEIPPEGGQIMVPNANAWIEFLPDTFSQPTNVSIIGTSFGQTKDEYLARFIVLPGDVRAEMEGGADLEEKLRTIMQDVEGQKLAKPLIVYYHYEPGYVGYTRMINLYRFDMERYEWLPTDVFVSETDRIAVAIDMEYWGDLVWTQSEGLLVPPPVVIR